MKRTMTAVLLTMALLLTGSTALADTFSFAKSQLEYTYDVEWTMERKGGKVKLISTDKALILIFSELEGAPDLAETSVKAGLKATGCTDEVKSSGERRKYNNIETSSFVCNGDIKGKKTLNVAFLYTSPVSGKYVFAYMIELRKPSEGVKKSALKLIKGVKALKK